jgi:uncharacterized protein YjiS (DUF1127 family)
MVGTSGTAWRPFRALRRWWRARRMAMALGALDNATLKDIGVYRCEIRRIARDQCAEQGMI